MEAGGQVHCHRHASPTYAMCAFIHCMQEEKREEEEEGKERRRGKGRRRRRRRGRRMTLLGRRMGINS